MPRANSFQMRATRICDIVLLGDLLFQYQEDHVVRWQREFKVTSISRVVIRSVLIGSFDIDGEEDQEKTYVMMIPHTLSLYGIVSRQRMWGSEVDGNLGFSNR